MTYIDDRNSAHGPGSQESGPPRREHIADIIIKVRPSLQRLRLWCQALRRSPALLVRLRINVVFPEYPVSQPCVVL
jgi:hypothetical protein